MPADDGPADWQRIDVEVDATRSDGRRTRARRAARSTSSCPPSRSTPKTLAAGDGQQRRSSASRSRSTSTRSACRCWSGSATSRTGRSRRRGPVPHRPEHDGRRPDVERRHLTYERSTLDYSRLRCSRSSGSRLLIFMRIRGDVRHADTHPFGSEARPHGRRWDELGRRPTMVVDPTPSQRWQPDVDDPLVSRTSMTESAGLGCHPRSRPRTSDPPAASVSAVMSRPIRSARRHLQGLRRPRHRARPAQRDDRPRARRRLRPLRRRRRPGARRPRHAPVRARSCVGGVLRRRASSRASTSSTSAWPRPTWCTSPPAASTRPARCSPPRTTRRSTTASSCAWPAPARSAQDTGLAEIKAMAPDVLDGHGPRPAATRGSSVRARDLLERVRRPRACRSSTPARMRPAEGRRRHRQRHGRPRRARRCSSGSRRSSSR